MWTEDDIIQRLRSGDDTVHILSADEANEIAATFEELRRERDAWRANHIAEIAKVNTLRGAMKEVIKAVQSTKIVPAFSGACGQTIEANLKASVYLRVPAWPIEEAINAYYETGIEQ